MSTNTHEFEKKIKELESQLFQFKGIINDIPGSIYWKDQNGIYLGCNQFALEKLIEVGLYLKSSSVEDVIGKNDYDLFSEEVADQYRLNDLEVLRTGKTLSKEEVFSFGHKKLIQLSHKRPLRNEKNEVVGIVGNTVDITYLKKVESALKKGKEKAEFVNALKDRFIKHVEHG